MELPRILFGPLVALALLGDDVNERRPVVFRSGFENVRKLLDVISVNRPEILDPEVLDEMALVTDNGILDLFLGLLLTFPLSWF